MASFGEKLKHEREARNRTIEEIGVATGIQLSYLEALEKNEFRSLPGRALGKLYIRAYAEILGFDPQPLIEDYDREQHQQRRVPTERQTTEPGRSRRVEAVMADWRESKIAERGKSERAEAALEVQQEESGETRGEQVQDIPTCEPHEIHEEAAPFQPSHVWRDGVIEDPATQSVEAWRDDSGNVPDTLSDHVRPNDAAPDTTSVSRRSVVAALLICGLFLVAVGAYLAMFGTGGHVSLLPSSVPSAQGAPDGSGISVVSPRESSDAAEPLPAPSPRTPLAGAASQSGRISVSEFGVGRRIVNHHLEGRDDPFIVGDAVLFSTRVLGGKPGMRVRHVWIHEGRAVSSIGLQLRGSDWRTYSRKTVRAAGQWAVEARDEQGRVLARTTFISVREGS